MHRSSSLLHVLWGIKTSLCPLNIRTMWFLSDPCSLFWRKAAFAKCKTYLLFIVIFYSYLPICVKENFRMNGLNQIRFHLSVNSLFYFKQNLSLPLPLSCLSDDWKIYLDHIFWCCSWPSLKLSSVKVVGKGQNKIEEIPQFYEVNLTT